MIVKEIWEIIFLLFFFFSTDLYNTRDTVPFDHSPQQNKMKKILKINQELNLTVDNISIIVLSLSVLV